MNRNRTLLLTGSLIGFAALVYGHHVPKALSSTLGAEILQQVVFRTSTGSFGVPAYAVGASEAPDHGAPVGLVDGDSFTVMDENGSIETVVLEAADFTDIASADMDEVVAVINAKAGLFEAIETNGFTVFQGQNGGAQRSLSVTDGAGGPLSKLGMNAVDVHGADDLELTISIPDPNLNLAGRPYIVLASATEGTWNINQKTLPLAVDGYTQPFIDAALSGFAAGFFGQLDGNSDATAHLTASQLQNGFGGAFPDKLHLAYVVFSANLRRIEYVSNRFTVDFQ